MTPADLLRHPEAWPCLLLVPLAALALRGLERRASARLARAVGPRLPRLAAGAAAPRPAWPFALGLLLGLLALLEPLGAPADLPEEQRGVDVVVCLDVSRSMRARDLAPDRLGAAQQALARLAEHARGDRLALVLFAGEARLAVPLTHDLSAVAERAALADPTDVARGGTDLGAALDAALALLEGRTGEHEAVVLLTDGDDLAGTGRAAAQRARARGIAVHAVGLGSEVGARLPREDGAPGVLTDAAGRPLLVTQDRAALAALAAAGGGRYVDGQAGPEALVALYDAALAPLAQRAYATEVRRRRVSLGALPLLGALLLLAYDLTARARPARAPRAPAVVAAPAPGRLAGAWAGAARALLALLPLVALTGCEAADRGRAHAEACLAALATSDLEAAVAAAARAAEAEPARYDGLLHQVRGLRAFRQSEAVETLARDAAAAPDALERARVLAEDAAAHLARAAAAEHRGPEVARNLERALRRVERLSAAQRRAGGGDPRRTPLPLPDPGEPPAPGPEAPPAPSAGAGGRPTDAPGPVDGAAPGARSPEGLLEVLTQKERAKRDLRRAERTPPPAGSEADR